MVRFALCNEVLREKDFAAQCDYAARLGYQGLELAPFTLGEAPHLLSSRRRRQIRRQAADSGLEIVGLHWLLLSPPGLSITATEPSRAAETIRVLRGLVNLCADLGGTVLVHGSPKQRVVAAGEEREAAWERALRVLEAPVRDAEAAGVRYCLEPLARVEDNFVNTIEEAVRFVGSLGGGVKTMIDCRAAGLSEAESVAELIDKWLPSGWIGHVHLNDRNRRGPGQGRDAFAPVLERLLHHDYRGFASVEPFEYDPDGAATAATCIGYLRGILESLRPGLS